MSEYRDMKSKKTVAWIVADGCEGYGDLVFHHHGLAARRIGAQMLDLEFESVEINRAPQFDEYAEQGFVPVKVLLDDGWWFECHYCGSRICNDSDEIDMDEVVIANDKTKTLYCSEAHQKAQKDQEAEVNARHDYFQQTVTAKRPDLAFTDFSTGWPSLTPNCKFSFPGCRYGGSAQMDRDTDEITWYIANGDRQAWEQYENNRAKTVTE